MQHEPGLAAEGSDGAAYLPQHSGSCAFNMLPDELVVRFFQQLELDERCVRLLVLFCAFC